MGALERASTSLIFSSYTPLGLNRPQVAPVQTGDLLIAHLARWRKSKTKMGAEEKEDEEDSQMASAGAFLITFLQFFYDKLLRLALRAGFVCEALGLRLADRSEAAETHGERIP